MIATNEPYFDILVRDFANGGSRREFVRHSATFAAIVGLSHAGLPPRFGRAVAAWLGIHAPCETDKDCGDPCLVCEVRAAGELKSCVLKCQAQCSRCSNGKCIDQCPAQEKCTVCYPGASYAGSTCVAVEVLGRCESCDRETGKLSSLCSACEKCEKGECISNCPKRCEICDNGTCRKCDGPCETCDDASGKCTGCSSSCERCDPTTKRCETTCPGGRACCEGHCVKCCGTCDRCLDPRAVGSDFCPAARNDADLGCCATTGCVNLKEDRRNCGSCLHSCKLSETCTNGRCLCQGVPETIGNITVMRGGGQECTAENHECCDGDCVDVAQYQSDPKHCGKCIVECDKDERCVKGECVASNRLSIQYAYTGFKFVESTPEDCPGMRRNGREVLSAKLHLVSIDADDSSTIYEGSGQLMVDIDGCGLTPNRVDPGMVHDRGDVPGDFHGDNFLGCIVTTVVPAHPVRVRLEVDMVDAHQPNYVKIEWEPISAPHVRVSTRCEPAYQASYVTQITKEYRRENRHEITSYDLLRRMAPSGRLREGTYTDPDGTDEGRWIFTVGKAVENPSLVE